MVDLWCVCGFRDFASDFASSFLRHHFLRPSVFFDQNRNKKKVTRRSYSVTLAKIIIGIVPELYRDIAELICDYFVEDDDVLVHIDLQYLEQLVEVM